MLRLERGRGPYPVLTRDKQAAEQATDGGGRLPSAHKEIRQMEEIVVESLDAIIRFAQDMPLAIAYRGLGDASHHLIPRVTRMNLALKAERDAIDHFRLHGRGVGLAHQPASELEWMSLGQHHGLATRLTDWTTNIMVAAFFAVEKSATPHAETESQPDAAIYALAAPYAFAASHRLPQDVLDDPLGWGLRYEVAKDPVQLTTVRLPTTKSPFDLAAALLFVPPVVSARISAQSALFFLPRDPTIPFDTYPLEKLIRIRIPVKRRSAIAKSLLACGVHRQALFPDLDGIASHANTLSVQGVSTEVSGDVRVAEGAEDVSVRIF
jgi:hypothetical protein